MLIPTSITGRRPTPALSGRLWRRSRPSETANAGPEAGSDSGVVAPTAAWTAVWETAANDRYFGIEAARRARVDALVRRLVTDRPSVPASYDAEQGTWSVDETCEGVRVRLGFRLVDTTRRLVISRVSAD